MVLDDDVMRRVGARKRACARRLIWSSGDYADDASRGLVSEECTTSPIFSALPLSRRVDALPACGDSRVCAVHSRAGWVKGVDKCDKRNFKK
jgi:hypothetical protein